MQLAKLLLSAVLGVGFFVFPVTLSGKTTVLFDVFVKFLTKGYPTAVGVYCLALILAGTVLTLARRPGYRTSLLFALLRGVGLLLAAMIFFGWGPALVLDPKISKLMWNILVYSVGVIIPIGAVFLNIFISYGCLEYVGTLMRPLMKPLFRLPGRSALDDITSWLGSYSVGLYLTRKLIDGGYYTRREAYTIITCFSTVSIGFVGVVAATLEILHLFPLIFFTYFIVTYLLAAILCRTWPVTRTPNTYIGPPNPEKETKGKYFATALERALKKAGDAPGFLHTVREGFIDGLKLASTILGTILAVGTMALLVAEHTPLFQWLGSPLIPLLRLLGLPDAEIIAPATIVGISEMYIPALMAKSAAVPAKFFIAVLSISQLIFFSSVGPMILDMFQDIPIRARELVALFFIRTALLIPILAGVTYLLGAAGLVV